MTHALTSGRGWPAQRVAHRSSRLTRVVPEVVLPLAIISAVIAARTWWPDVVLATAALLIVPGVMLLRALRVPADSVAANPAYVPIGSLVVLTASGLAVDLVGIAAHHPEPLRARPLAVGVLAACAVLAIAGLTSHTETFRVASLGIRVGHYWPVLLPVAAAAGAARLNAGGSGSIAIAAAVAATVALAIGFVVASRLRPAHLNVILFSVALAFVWAVSLRGQLVYGYDIASEFHLFSSTANAGVWHPSHRGDAYGAMLSLTILPTLLHSLTGLSDLLVFKLLYPALFALLPVAVTCIARRFVAARWAYLAGGLLIVQSYFATQLPAVARQEIGLLAFAGLLATVLDRSMSRASRVSLALLFGLLMVVSHYTTTYIAVGMLAVTVVAMLVWSALRRRWIVDAAVVAALLATALGAAGWYGAATHSTANVSHFVADVRSDGLQLLPSRHAGEGVFGSYLSGNTVTTVSPSTYQQLVEQSYSKLSFIKPLPAASSLRYQLSAAPAVSPPSSHPAAASDLARLQQVIEIAIEGLAGLGALGLIARRRSPGLRLVGLLGLSTFGILIAVRFSGTVALDYNQSRALLQALVPLSIAAVWVVEWVAGRIGRLSAAAVPAIAAVGVVALSLQPTGLSTVALGGDRPASLSAHGEDSERFVLSNSEAAGAQWLNVAAPQGAPVFADRYGVLRILEATGREFGVFADVAPQVVDQHGWVYADEPNLIGGRARGSIGSDSATYAFDKSYFDRWYDEVYDDGTSAVWHR